MKIVIVEDDINMRKSLEFALSEYQDFVITCYKNANDALKKIEPDTDLVITDINMPGMDGIEFVKRLENRFDIIVITGNATLNRAIDSIRLGVKDFLTKPFEIDTLVNAINRNVKLRSKVSKKTKTKTVENRYFLGTSKALETSLALAKKAAKTDATILLLGESGVGKELFANYVHDNSKRAGNAFVAINMAAIPDNLLESELFGYEKGAFTDATSAKQGYFELAHKGTLFLDEIAEMSIALQSKILRVLQERVIYRVGGVKPIPIDVRVISATNANITENIRNGKFREDLYFRLNTIPIKIAPLRERKEEILTIAQKVLLEVKEKYELGEKHFSKEAEESLLSYAWHGNIRELISVVERAAILSDDVSISANDLFLESRSEKKNIKNMEIDLIKEVLQSVDHDITEASKILVMSKKSLMDKINKYNIGVNNEKI
ncbi:sigma-54-dependent transcriptional regulator [Sulfurospirillum sp. 1612]|uniref:sigma-54-dependent transcriptional regulator n=1 Tax=Sulfurospirillum sp. 1612 TaxID=3094835 RepID=UPI002F93C188